MRRLAFLLTAFLALPLAAQEGAVSPPAEATSNAAPDPGAVGADTTAREELRDTIEATQGDGPPAPTLEDILARQRGERIDPGPRALADGQPDGPLAGVAPEGGVSDADLWRAIRFANADATLSLPGQANEVLIQDSGMPWLQFRDGPLLRWGGLFLVAVLGVLALFYLAVGRKEIEHGRAGTTVKRFGFIERTAHWTLAGSFVLLAITGLLMLWGRSALIPLLGKDAYANLALGCIWVHNNVSWAFMIALVIVFALWVAENIPNRHDWKWIKAGGGMVGTGNHPPAKKFNAGQKMIFWATIILGASISASGLSLLFPFDLPMFAKTFAAINMTGIPQLLGGALPTDLTPHAEMQLAQAWHAIVAFVFIGIIFGHIYLGSVGMEGAFWAMGTGDVDEQWAKEHHNLWYDEVKSGGVPEDRSGTEPRATPAE